MRQLTQALFAGLRFAAPTYASEVEWHQFRQSAQAPIPVALPPASNQSFIPVATSAFQAPDPGPDPNSDSVSAIAGQYQVDAAGAATYSVPLYVPTGSANMQPTVALNYSSRAPNGPLGVGWSIGGLSVVSRCKQDV